MNAEILKYISPSHVLQVGSNDHSGNRNDIVPKLIKLGWNATLVEPIPYLYKLLRKKYANNKNVVALNTIVSSNCNDKHSKIYSIALNNETGTFDTNDADIRCLTVKRGFHWVFELSSFSISHLTKHQNNLLYFTPHTCSLCNKKYGGNRSANCLHNVIRRNVIPYTYPSSCLANIINKLEYSLPTALIVDAEGADSDIVSSYPFSFHKPKFIGFETKHLSSREKNYAFSTLRRNFYNCTRNCIKFSSMSEWNLIPHNSL